MPGQSITGSGGSRRRVLPAAAVLVLGTMAALAAGGTGRAEALAGAAAPRAGAAAAGDISTVAGGPGGPAKATNVALWPLSVSFDGGRLYIGDFEGVPQAGAVRKVNPRTGWLTTAAGTKANGPLGDGGPASRATLKDPDGTALDASGNLVIADGEGDRIRVVAARTGTFYKKAMTAGDIYTVAGNGKGGFSGDGGQATSARLDGPTRVAVDDAGNLLIADSGNSRIRAVAARTGTFYGQAMTAGDIYTVAGDGGFGFSGDGSPATKAELFSPQAVALDPTGNLLIADTGNSRIRVVAAATGTFYGQAMTADHIYTIAGDGTRGFSGDGGLAVSAELAAPDGVAVDGAGNLAIADNRDYRVRVVAARTGMFYGQAMTAGHIYTVAGTGRLGSSGDGGPAVSAKLAAPDGVAVDGAGNLVIADLFRVRVVAATGGTFYGQAMTAGDIYTVAGTGGLDFSGNGGPATSAQLNEPAGLAVDSAGNEIISDTGNNEVRAVAVRTGTFYGRPMTAGHIYDVAGGGSAYPGNGGPAINAGLLSPTSVALDAAGNLLIADRDHNLIRVVAAGAGTFYGQAMTAGDIYTVAGDGETGFSGDGGPAASAELDVPDDMAVDGAGNVVIADTFDFRIRVVAARTGTFYGRAMTAGDIYTVAGTGQRGWAGNGGPATSAELDAPQSVAVDGAGNLVIADTDNNRVRVVAARAGTFYGQPMTAGDIYRIAGHGKGGFSGDGGPAIQARLRFPGAVTLDGAGNLMIADTGNNRVRVVAARAGTFYGRPMTAGDIYTVAGTGPLGFSGDGGPATRAELSGPSGVTVNSAGGLLIADTDNNRIRAVAG